MWAPQDVVLNAAVEYSIPSLNTHSVDSSMDFTVLFQGPFIELGSFNLRNLLNIKQYLSILILT